MYSYWCMSVQIVINGLDQSEICIYASSQICPGIFQLKSWIPHATTQAKYLLIMAYLSEIWMARFLFIITVLILLSFGIYSFKWRSQKYERVVQKIWNKRTRLNDAYYNITSLEYLSGWMVIINWIFPSPPTDRRAKPRVFGGESCLYNNDDDNNL